MRQIILASKSPRRKELLSQIGMTFTVIPACGEERIQTTDPVEAVKELSLQKAREIGVQQDSDVLIIGADTIVVHEGQILGKPSSPQDAAVMLSMLQGRTHSVFTGVTLLCGPGDSRTAVTFAEETRVTFYPMSNDEIQWYIRTGEPLDKAGAYGIQGLAAVFVRSIEGDYQNVVGLPVARLYQEMKRRGWADADRTV
ncbi:Maf family protein [Ruminococcus sp. OA3]|uniref:Maf family protein n=1 Tax=Ruminococcus sp. OA3 TaxID=2914164 RepID=UPI001F063FAF|nr:Maf family protein [Ruminococcus sp. OA3]MCH1983906.1 Maf family protein [Ruminococcus sp. OA3]